MHKTQKQPKRVQGGMQINKRYTVPSLMCPALVDRVILSTLSLTLVFNPMYGKETCYRSNGGGLSICPWPVVVKQNQNFMLKIGCGTTDSNYDRLVIGVHRTAGNVGDHRIFYILTKEKGKKVIYSTYDPYKLEGKTAMSETANSIHLTVDSASLKDLDNNWACLKDPGGIPGYTAIEAIPYPHNTNLTVDPPQHTYKSADIVNLICEAFTVMNFIQVGQEQKSTFIFQYYNGDSETWVTISKNDRLQIKNVTKGPLKTEGMFRKRNHTIQLMVSSIPGCSRRYRCVLTFKQNMFDKDMPEVTINRTLCEGGCGLDLEICKAITLLHSSPATTRKASPTAHNRSQMSRAAQEERTKRSSTGRELGQLSSLSHGELSESQNVAPSEGSQSSNPSVEDSSVVKSETGTSVSLTQSEAATSEASVVSMSEVSVVSLSTRYGRATNK